MLYTFKALPNDIYEKLQNVVKHIVIDIWCVQDGSTLESRNTNAQFQEIVNNLKGKIESIDSDFRKLTLLQIERIKEGYFANNEVEQLCNGSHNPITYSEIDTFYPPVKDFYEGLGQKIKSFFIYLYDHGLDLKCFKDNYGTKSEYYKRFVELNRVIASTCPFCGLKNLKGSEMSIRDAFDHYFPKAIFPFNSINSKNLFPACGECNEDFKGRENPIFEKQSGIRRKAFFPLSTPINQPEIKVSLKTSNLGNLKFEDIDLVISHASYPEEIQTWTVVYGIQERYKDLFCSGDGKYWAELVKDEANNYGVSASECYNFKVSEARRRPFRDKNFLKAPFLEACHTIGMFA